MQGLPHPWNVLGTQPACQDEHTDMHVTMLLCAAERVLLGCKQGAMRPQHTGLLSVSTHCMGQRTLMLHRQLLQASDYYIT